MFFLPSRRYRASPVAVATFAIGTFLLPLPALSQNPADGVSGLRAAVTGRLALIPDVARHKWNTAAVIADPTREQRVIEAAVVYGRSLGLSDRITQVAIEAQIAAAKDMQHELIQSWRERGAVQFSPVPDFIRETRPKIEKATDHLIGELGAALDLLTTCPGATALRQPPTGGPASASVWSRAVEGLIQSAGGPPEHACPPP